MGPEDPGDEVIERLAALLQVHTLQVGCIERTASKFGLRVHRVDRLPAIEQARRLEQGAARLARKPYRRPRVELAA